MPKSYLKLPLILFLFILAGFAAAQELPEVNQDEAAPLNGSSELDEPSDSEEQENEDLADTRNPESDNAEDALPDSKNQEEETEETEENVIQKSLLLDINTATTEELVAWNRILGLPDSDSKGVLQQQLRQYYKLADDDREAGTRQIKIESSNRMEYLKFQVRNEEESIIELTGGVSVSFSESEIDRVHNIKADTIIFNRDNETISAIGNIEYVVDTNGRKERFSGDNLILRTQKWTGVIFRGTSERTQKVKSNTVDFFFRGEDIIKAGSEIIVLNEGLITSDDQKNSYYSLRAEKIWITGPGEWGLVDAIIYVGHIPTFYIPFYWKPGNDLIFNPVIGTQTRRGYYIQTTTYLLGSKDYGDQFSIMGFGDSGSGDFTVEREGWFAVRKRAKADEEKKSDNYVKYMLDVYTNIGVMTGFKGKFPSLTSKNLSLDFDFRIAGSRSVNDNGNPNFQDSGAVRQYWHSGYFIKLEIPFRWYAKLGLKFGQWNFDFSSYSDRDFLNDFAERRENFDWLSFFLGEEDEPEKTTRLGDSELKIKGSQSFNVGGLSPWVGSFSMSNFSAYMKWKTRTDENFPTTRPDYNYNPTKQFYYPSEILIPKIEFAISGSSPKLEIPFEPKEESPAEEESGDSKEPDDTESDSIGQKEDGDEINKVNKEIDEDEQTEEELEQDEQKLKFSDYYNSELAGSRFKNIFEASMNYSLSNIGIAIESSTDNSKWKKPQDVELEFRPQRIKTTSSAQLGYNMGFIDNMFKFSGKTKFSLFYQLYYDLFSSGIKITDDEKIESYKYSKVNWDNDLTFSLTPLKLVRSFSSSSIVYKLNTKLYEKKYDSGATKSVDNPQFTDDWIIDDDKKYFKNHEAELTINWKPGLINTANSVTAVFPPLDQKLIFNNSIGFNSAGWSSKLSQKTEYEESKETQWKFQPIIFNLSWTGFKSKLKFSQSLSYDLQEGRMKESTSTIYVWGFKADFVADYGKSYEWNKTTFVWEEKKDGENFSAKSFALSYDLSGNKIYLWKNRIFTKTTTSIKWNINIRKITENTLDFTISQQFNIYKFIDLKLSFTAENRSIFLYSQDWRDRLGITTKYDFFDSLLKSFNIFEASAQDRRESKFNMKKLTLSVVHHMKNWDLSFSYSGQPSLEKGETKYKWKSEFTISLIWNPLPIFNQKSKYKDDKWSVESFKSDS